MVRELRTAYEKLAGKIAGDSLLDGLESPALVLWTDDEIDTHSKKAMEEFAASNGIAVVKIGGDHAERAWQRFFSIKLPFDPGKRREDRRKDIPDSWILEAAIDMKAQYPNLRALCCDERLSNALRANGIQTEYGATEKAGEITRTFLDELEAELAPPAPAAQEVPTKTGPAAEALKEHELTVALDDAQRQFKDLEIRVLGYIAYLETPTKEQLFGLLEKSGVPVDTARNITKDLPLRSSF